MKSRMEAMAGRVAAVLLVSAGLFVSAAVAQNDAPPPPQGQMQGPPPGGPRGPMEDPARRTMRLQKQLGLSDEQTAQVKTVLADSGAKMETLRANQDLDPRDRRTQMMALRKDEETRLEAIFTPDQKAKYEEMMAQERARMQNRGGGPGGPPTPPPSR